MKKGKSGHTQSPIMEEADVYDAIQALRNQEPLPIGMFLNDAAPILSKIADLLNPPAETDCEVRLQFSVPPEMAPAGTEEDECEWEGSRSQVEEAIRARHPALLGWYLCDLADFLAQLAPDFAPPEGSRDWGLGFRRTGRGRRADKTKIFSDSNAMMKLRFATLNNGGKQDASIAGFKDQKGMSRASIFRKKKAAKESRKYR
jgi:hypothetical protein